MTPSSSAKAPLKYLICSLQIMLKHPWNVYFAIKAVQEGTNIFPCDIYFALKCLLSIINPLWYLPLQFSLNIFCLKDLCNIPPHHVEHLDKFPHGKDPNAWTSNDHHLHLRRIKSQEYKMHAVATTSTYIYPCLKISAFYRKSCKSRSHRLTQEIWVLFSSV